ncbi:MAG TPA: GNAT family N-acetyltransferase [Acetobacteraceae bacterium]|jgi:L-amino acid N-acyltransferase YncA|nr:GNAT family N-acetyltransferase [Acetobacteraceae bacterium]
MLIRDATEADLPGILTIYNHVIATSNAVYTETPSTLEDRQAWFAARRATNFPVLVADDRGVLGFASFGDFRPWPGYALSVEHSVHVSAMARGRGIGTALVQRLIEEAQTRGKHVMIAGIDATNAASIALHHKLEFTEVGVLREVARKFSTWLDLLFMQRML